MYTFIIGFIFFIISWQTYAEELETVEVQGISPIKDTIIWGGTADLLGDFAHIQSRKNGGLADTPSIGGLSNDRVNIKIDGTIITNSCPNHMNPALSFVHPDQVAGIQSFAGLDPVSNGGDNIAGTILIQTKNINFAKKNTESGIKVRSFYKSNNFNSGVALNTYLSSKNYYFSYDGIQEKADRYKDGNGARLKGTLYEYNNQSLTVARKLEGGDLSASLSRSNIPYQGFVNQYMDLLSHQTDKGQIALNKKWNKLKMELLSSFTHTSHFMNKLKSERVGNMPMDTRSDEFNTSLKFTYGPALNYGFEYFQYRLEDWWDPVHNTMMGPRSFKSIHHGKRERFASYIENTFNKGEKIEILVGMRTDVVMMSTGKVSGYNDSMNAPADASFFNSQKRSKTDFNIDAHLGIKYKYSNKNNFEAGYARKTRSPNMYERYAWAGTQSSQGMDMRMINWFGDGNGYVGDIDLRPEVAHKFSLKYSFNDRDKLKVEVKPFFTYVQNFIDANVLREVDGINYLQFANEDALLYGFDFNADLFLYSDVSIGDLSMRFMGSYTRGYRVDKKADLYHLMPLNASLGLKHQLSFWSNELTLRMVGQKHTVNKLRLEAQTSGYALLDFATRFKWSKFTWELGVSNILDKAYQMPLAGVDLINYPPASQTAQFGMGRSYNTNLIMEF